MCTRINNIEALIRVLPQLERKLEKASGVIPVEQKHFTAHGYVSSEANDGEKLVKHPTTTTSSNGSEWTGGHSSNVLNQVKRSQHEEGFHSESSQQLHKYLKQLRHAQLLLMCHRVNTVSCLVIVVVMVTIDEPVDQASLNTTVRISVAKLHT